MGRLIDVNKFKADYGMKDNCADCDKELRGKSKACEYDRVYTKMDFCGWLDDAPTVDAVPVVRCKDCKWYGYYSCEMGGISWMRDGNGFCDRGVRKDGDRHDSN